MTYEPLTARRACSVIVRNELESGALFVAEYQLPNWYRADLWALGADGTATEWEVKLSVSDYRRDAISKGDKHRRLAVGDTTGPNRFYYVVPFGLILVESAPKWAGVVELLRTGRDRWRACVAKEAPVLHVGTVDDVGRRHLYRTISRNSTRAMVAALEREATSEG